MDLVDGEVRAAARLVLRTLGGLINREQLNE